VKQDFPSVESLEHAAWMLGCSIAAIQTVAEVEAANTGAFLDDGTPAILYERHLFHRLTAGRYDGARISDGDPEHQLLSSSTPGGYGPIRLQHKKLAAAVELDRNAALEACSWGLFQILGMHYAQAGFSRLQSFINAMYASVDEHLRAFVCYIRSDESLLEALRDRDWTAFARAYNGPGFAKNHYDTRLAEAFQRFEGRHE